ncbi:hypothetical protein ColKHC_06412 [Colletotrichum higginsianum]|nr:hypothetical protein ColKHC_06412 [Colletotrichum higginsianum]
MKATTLATLAVSALLSGVSAKEIAPSELVSEIYDSGVIHKDIMARKKASWDRQIESGEMDSTAYRSRLAEEGPVACVDGVAAVVPGDANNTFKCNKVDFYDFKSHADLGSRAGQGSSSWGWTSPDGREFAIIAQADGAAFAEITADGKLVYLGRLPQYSTQSIWRELRGYKNYVEKQYAVAVGAQPRSSACRSGLIFIDLSDPSKPTSPGCAAGDGYVHDAQCLVYRGPDEKYFGRDICYGYNEDTLTIYDVTKKNETNIISRTSYEGASCKSSLLTENGADTHQGWVTNTEWQEFLVLDDEYDEVDATGPAASGYPITYFWDIRSLENPKQTGFYRSEAYGIDHNQFVIDGLAYQSNYGSGLRILDVSSLPEDPTGSKVSEVGFFDIYPENDNEPKGGSIDFVGTWSHYPYFKSGHILVNTIERGAFVVKRAA